MKPGFGKAEAGFAFILGAAVTYLIVVLLNVVMYRSFGSAFHPLFILLFGGSGGLIGLGTEGCVRLMGHQGMGVALSLLVLPALVLGLSLWSLHSTPGAMIRTSTILFPLVIVASSIAGYWLVKPVVMNRTSLEW